MLKIYRLTILAAGVAAMLTAGCGGSATPAAATGTSLTSLNDFVAADGEKLLLRINNGAAAYKGTSTLKGYENWVELDSLKFGSSNSGSAHAGGGAGAGKVSFEDLSFTKGVDGASPALALANWRGSHLADAVLAVVRTDAKGTRELYRIALTDALITSFAQELTADDAGRESLTLSFAQITITYKPVLANGSSGTPVVVSWDVTTGTSLRAVLRSVGLGRN